MRYYTLFADSTANLNTPGMRNIFHMAIIWHIDIMFAHFVIDDSIDHVASSIRVIGSTTLFELLWFNIQCRVLIECKKLFLNFFHHLSTRFSLVVFTQQDG
ncbi:hypothetical protein D3C77_414030 [compost metagenome]